ncbi:MBL fold metallo-hydrolase [Acetobacterium fimetarium]|uniref:MBL fold metallo-hydrolase n=1 Tax=Acetobacterium fimetarium TaxID=52691 RepID=A0ABR6WQK8_9FIRM|nr:MBL fold metallo-hydrolase [Acetobacterium fimetarium]MBC3802893.1 MBL fold metallo-hydrolase [Acetobacterium fimetarium]
MKVKFLGAAISVTGSCHLITTDKYKFLLDCGLFQGNEALEELNYLDFDFMPSEIDFMILSHAHVDHCGRIPLLVKGGFKGKIYCTGATAEIADIMLQDSGNIHEMDAAWKNKRSRRSGRAQVKPLYTQDEAAVCARYFSPVNYGQMIEIGPGMTVRLCDAGHILGAAIVELWIEEGGKKTKLVYSGDIGDKNQLMLNEPTLIEEADYLIMETTYGDRAHETHAESSRRFMDIIFKTISRGGTIVVPSFALGRTQELIRDLELFYESHEKHRKTLDRIMVYVDSPLATNATEIFRRNARYFNEKTQNQIAKGDEILNFKNLKFTRSVDQSKQLNHNKSPKIIIASSGMADAGRVQHHLKHNLWLSKNSIVFVGFQAEGTLGRAIIKGEKFVGLLRERVRVNAEIYSLEGFSAHADRDYLLEWLSGFKAKPKSVFLVHGDEVAKEAFATTVKNILGYDCTIIREVSEYTLDDEDFVTVDDVRSRIDTKEEIIRISNRMENLHDELDAMLHDGNRIADEALSQETIRELSSHTEELEKILEKNEF